MLYFIDNIIFNLQKAGGISVVWQNLIKNLLTLTSEVKFLEFPTNNNIFRTELAIPHSNIIAESRFYPVISQFLHPNVNVKNPFIFHSSYFRTCKNPNAINVTTVHDFIYEQYTPNFKQKLRIRLNYKAIRNSDAIVCISENTRKDLFRFLPDIDPKKVHVIYNGVSEDYKVIRKDEIYRRLNNTILFVGGRQGYKNFNFVVDSLINSDFNLLVCGSPLSTKEIEALECKLPNRYESVIFPSNAELNKIYNSVYALAYPSSYEGFGIPVLEAQRAGCPVIALKASSIPEIIGNTPLLMTELSRVELIRKLELLRDYGFRQKVIYDGIANSHRFSWGKMANEYFNLYNKLLEKHKAY